MQTYDMLDTFSECVLADFEVFSKFFCNEVAFQQKVKPRLLT